MNQVIQLDGILSNVQNDEIQVYSSNTIVYVSDQFDYAIETQFASGEPTLSYIIYTNETVSALQFGQTQLNQFLYAESIESTVAFGDSLPKFIVYPESTTTENAFGTNQINAKIFAESTTTENAFGTGRLSYVIFANAVNPSTLFGNARLNQEIDDVPFPSIESTLVIPTPNVLKVIGPLSVAPTANFGTSSFIDNIHRILIFKDDNISKIGENDAAVIAGGIRINPASVVSQTAAAGEAELPAAPVGFLSVNINGVDYKIPYYNS